MTSHSRMTITVIKSEGSTKDTAILAASSTKKLSREAPRRLKQKTPKFRQRIPKSSPTVSPLEKMGPKELNAACPPLGNSKTKSSKRKGEDHDEKADFKGLSRSAGWLDPLPVPAFPNAAGAGGRATARVPVLGPEPNAGGSQPRQSDQRG